MRLSALLLLTAVSACTIDEPGAPATDPNAGLLRDFLDGKFDSAGHPINARVTEGDAICGATRLTQGCEGALAGSEQAGDLVASLRVSIKQRPATGTVLSASIIDSNGSTLATTTLKTSQLRNTTWLDVPLSWSSTGQPVSVRVQPAAGTALDLDYIEVFPQRFGLVATPGSGTFSDTDKLTFELPKGRKLDRVMLDGTDITARLTQLITAGKATRTTTAFRTLFEVSVADLAPERRESSELELRAGTFAARMQLRRNAPACKFEGDPNGVKVLVTGFQPFPADGWHDNVSGVAVTALDPSHLRGAQVMRVVMPVEYDRAAAEVTDIIARCAPQAVLSFGQGGGSIALEQVAYNLQDTGEVAGGVPDNRGIIRAAVEIDPAAPSTRDTLLPLDAIRESLEALGEAPQPSTDPGRYICNNVMFADIGAMQGHGVAGFIHLPYTTQFDAATKTRFANVVESAIQATVDSL